jgi:hypothetical protein
MSTFRTATGLPPHNRVACCQLEKPGLLLLLLPMHTLW